MAILKAIGIVFMGCANAIMILLTDLPTNKFKEGMRDSDGGEYNVFAKRSCWRM